MTTERPTTTAQRFGLVLGWIGNLFAVLFAAWALLVWLDGGERFFIVFPAVLAAIAYAIGRALRFIFVG